MIKEYSIFIALFFVFSVSCKVQKSEDFSKDSQVLLILLKDNYSVSDLELLSSDSIESAKRISRSQNLWTVSVTMDDIEKESIINKLSGSDKVISVSQWKSKESTTKKGTVYTNKDKKKYKPNNNNP